MPKKYTYNEVKQIISDISNGQTKLLSEEYVNDRTPLLFECKCGDLFTRTFNKYKANRPWCEKCARQIAKDKETYDLSYIISEIEKTGCHYISGDYVNSESKLCIECRCGKPFYRTWHKFHGGFIDCEDCGKKKIADSKRKYDYNKAKEEFARYGYLMIDDTFVDVATKTHCLCKRGHDCYLTISGIKTHRSGCQECAILDNSGENHWNYKGGISLLEDKIRYNLKEWKEDVRNAYGKQCPITGDAGLNAVVHHLYSLVDIFNQACLELGYDIKKTSSLNGINLSDDQIATLIDAIKHKHTLSIGILISKNIHIKFHQEYGKGNNTPQQFDEFLINNYGISLNDIQTTKMKYNSKLLKQSFLY